MRREKLSETPRVAPNADERPRPKVSKKGLQKGSRKARRQPKPQPLRKAAKCQRPK